MASEDGISHRSSFWTGIALGLGIASFAGFLTILVLVFKRQGKKKRKKQKRLAPGLDVLPSTSTNGVFGAVPLSPGPPPGEMTDNNASVFRTIRLPSMSNPRSVARMIAAADNLPYVVVVRAVAPPGAFVVLCDDPAQLVGETSMTPTGGTAIVPVGQDMKIRLSARQAVYAKGSTDDVTVSVTKAPALMAPTG